MNETLSTTLHQERAEPAQWRDGYNHDRPHLGLGWLTPSEFASPHTPAQAIALGPMQREGFVPMAIASPPERACCFAPEQLDHSELEFSAVTSLTGEALDGPIVFELADLLPNMRVPEISAYPPEIVVVEKFEAMVRFGEADRRIKDFNDIWAIMQTFNFEMPTLV